MFNLKFESSKKKEAPFSKAQYDYILADLLKRKEILMAGLKTRHDLPGRKINATDSAFNRLIDSIWKEQYAYYKK